MKRLTLVLEDNMAADVLRVYALYASEIHMTEYEAEAEPALSLGAPKPSELAKLLNGGEKQVRVKTGTKVPKRVKIPRREAEAFIREAVEGKEVFMHRHVAAHAAKHGYRPNKFWTAFNNLAKSGALERVGGDQYNGYEYRWADA